MKTALYNIHIIAWAGQKQLWRRTITGLTLEEGLEDVQMILPSLLRAPDAITFWTALEIRIEKTTGREGISELYEDYGNAA